MSEIISDLNREYYADWTPEQEGWGAVDPEYWTSGQEDWDEFGLEEWILEQEHWVAPNDERTVELDGGMING